MGKTVHRSPRSTRIRPPTRVEPLRHKDTKRLELIPGGGARREGRTAGDRIACRRGEAGRLRLRVLVAVPSPLGRRAHGASVLPRIPLTGGGALVRSFSREEKNGEACAHQAQAAVRCPRIENSFSLRGHRTAVAAAPGAATTSPSGGASQKHLCAFASLRLRVEILLREIVYSGGSRRLLCVSASLRLCVENPDLC
jgi:hypothetical protein